MRRLVPVFLGVTILVSLLLIFASPDPHQKSSTQSKEDSLSAQEKVSAMKLESFEKHKDRILADIKAIADQGDIQAALNKSYTYHSDDEDLKALQEKLKVDLVEARKAHALEQIESRRKAALEKIEHLLQSPPATTKGIEYEKYLKEVYEAYSTACSIIDGTSPVKEKEAWERKWKKAKETRLYAEAKAIPASNLLGNANAYRELMYLVPDNKLYKKKYIHYQNKYDRQKRQAELRQASDIELLSWRWHKGYGWATAEGQVKNISGRKMEYVEARVTWFDKQGRMITSRSSYLEYTTLMPWQSSPFKVMAQLNPLMATARIEFIQRGKSVIHFEAQ